MARTRTVVLAVIAAIAGVSCGTTQDVSVPVQLALGASCNGAAPESLVLEQGGRIGAFVAEAGGDPVDSSCVTAAAGSFLSAPKARSVS